MNRSKRGIQKFMCVLMPAAAAQDGNGQNYNFTVVKFVVDFHQKKYTFILKIGVLPYDIIDTLMD